MSGNLFAQPLNVSAALTHQQIPAWSYDYLAEVLATTERPTSLFRSFISGDQTIRDGVNHAVEYLTADKRPVDKKAAFLFQDGTGTGKGFEAVLVAKALSAHWDQPALLVTRRDLIPGLRGDLVKLGLSSDHLEIAATEDLATVAANSLDRKTSYAAVILDEAQDLRFPVVQGCLDLIPAKSLVLLSATPYRNGDEFSHLVSRLDAERPAPSLDVADIRSTVTRLTQAGAIVHREFPFWGNFQSPLLANVSFAGTEQTTAVRKDYQEQLDEVGTPEARVELEHRLAMKLNSVSDRDKFSILGDAVRRELTQGRKVVVFYEEHQGPMIESDPGFGQPFQHHLQSLGIEAAVIRAPETPSRPLLPRERNAAREAQTAASNQREMNRFIDGLLYDPQTRTFARCQDDSGQAVYSPSQTRVLLLPYSQAPGWAEINQRFEDAPRVTQLLLPVSEADDFLQAVGRGSRRNSCGPARCRVVSSTHDSDRVRLQTLNAGLKVLAANGSPTVAVVQNAVSIVRDQIERAMLGQTNEQNIASRVRQGQIGDHIKLRPQGIRAG